jgi:hypothetical protein
LTTSSRGHLREDSDAVIKVGCRCTVEVDIVNGIGEIDYLVPSARLPDYA